MRNDSRSGWLDEFWTFALVAPYLLAFVPGAQDAVSRGFAILTDAVPVWYQAGIAAAIAWGFGRKALLSLGLSRR